MLSLKDYLNNKLLVGSQNSFIEAFFLIKPTFTDKVDEICKYIYNSADVIVCRTYPVFLNITAAEELYRDHKGKKFFKDLCEYIASGRCEVCEMRLYKKFDIETNIDNIVEAQKIFNDKLKDDIREKWGVDEMCNTVHSPDTEYAEIVRQLNLLRNFMRF